MWNSVAQRAERYIFNPVLDERGQGVPGSGRAHG